MTCQVSAKYSISNNLTIKCYLKTNHMKLSRILIALYLALASSVSAKNWEAKWITSNRCQSQSNSWICFQKSVTLPALKKGETIHADIAVDSKYWLWINGEMVVFEGGLKRGPNPKDTYYDHVDITSYLTEGENSIALLMWYFGKDGFSHNSSGKAGLLFDCQAEQFKILSDGTWLCKYYDAYEETGAPYPNYRLPESNIRFNAQKEIVGWTEKGAKPKFSSALALGDAGMSPWNNLIERPIPLWKNYGMKDYVSIEKKEGAVVDTFYCKLPYNCHATPYLDVEASAGKEIRIQTDDYMGGSEPNVRAEYVTKQGKQSYESLGWMNGHVMIYQIPKDVKVNALRYRETGYNTQFTGTFTCNDDFLNRLREKAVRTLYVTMRDTYMDCPDRERSQWWGDEVNELGEAFYATDLNGHKLAYKGIHELMGWQRNDGVIFSPCPAANWRSELPAQMLASVGYYGFRTYYYFSGDSTFVPKVYNQMKRYLHDVWKVDNDGWVITRHGDWSWGDWGNNIDLDLLLNAWYYLALKGERDFARILQKTEDLQAIDALMERIENNFNKRFWTGTAYRSPDYKGATDDRGQALAVLAGLAEPKQYPAIYKVLQKEYHASPFMEKYVGEALFVMGYPTFALQRTRERFANMVNHPELTTLWEGWGIGAEGYGGGSINHAWSGGTLTLLSQYVAGISPVKPGFEAFEINPQMGDLTSAQVTVDTRYGLIKADLKRTGKKIRINFEVPEGSTAYVVEKGKRTPYQSGQHSVTITTK